MAKNDQYWVDLLASMILDTEMESGARLASAIVIKNRLISVGINHKKSHPFQARFGRNAESIFLHSETHAIHNALKRVDTRALVGSTMYVVRVKYSDQWKTNQIYGLAKPCVGCYRAIVEFGIGRVVYTTNEQTLLDM